MREIVRKSLVNALSLFLISQAFQGLQITGGLTSYLWAGVLLAVISIIVDPVVKIVTLPFNLLTLGLLSFLTVMVALFIVTIFYNNVHVGTFVFSGANILGIELHKIKVSGFLSLVVFSGTIYLSNRFIDWLFAK